MKPASPARRVILPAAAAILISAGAFYAGRFFPFEGASGSRGKAPVVASIPDPRKDVEEQKRTGHARSPTKATPVQSQLATPVTTQAFVAGRIPGKLLDLLALEDAQVVQLEAEWQATIRHLQALEKKHSKVVTQPDGGEVVRIEAFWESEGAAAYQTFCDAARRIAGAEKARLLIPAIAASGSDSGGFGSCAREVFVDDVVAGDDGRRATRLMVRSLDPLQPLVDALKQAKSGAEQQLAQQELTAAQNARQAAIPVRAGPNLTLSPDHPWMRARYGFLLSESPPATAAGGK